MPAAPESRSKNGSRVIACLRLLSKQVGRSAFQKYGCGILVGIRTVLGRHRVGFDWKEIATSLHISSAGVDGSFWREMKRTPSNQMQWQVGPGVIQESKVPDSSRHPNSKTSQ